MHYSEYDDYQCIYFFPKLSIVLSYQRKRKERDRMRERDRIRERDRMECIPVDSSG
jgi:hypothetical protein